MLERGIDLRTVSINPKIIRWGIDRSGLNEQAIEAQFPKLRFWLSGDKFPTYNQLEHLSKKIKLPIGYFFLRDIPEEKLPIPFFRTLEDRATDTPSPELIDTVYSIHRRMLWLREYSLETGQNKLEFVGSAKKNDSIQEVAASIRNSLGFPEGWAQHFQTWQSALSHLRNKIDEAGINIVVNGIVGNNTRRSLNPQEFRGFALVDDYAPFIFVNNADFKAAQMFTIAHELAHVWYGNGAIFDLHQMQPADNALEIRCNKVAAEFLVPADTLEHKWNSIADKRDIYQQMANIFKVSEIVIARRLLDTDLISKKAFFDFYNAYIAEADERAKKKTGSDFYNNQTMRIGKSFMRAIVQAVGEGNLQYTDAYRLCGLYGSTFDAYAEKKLGAQ